METVPERFAKFGSPAQVWDLICGLCDEQPSQPTLVEGVSGVLRNRVGKGPWRILDLGGGSGGAAIGLAALGHQVVVVDIDPWMTATCRFRLQRIGLSGTVLQADFRNLTADYLVKHTGSACFDAVICLGNALGYQDSWPNDRPSSPLTVARLTGIFERWAGLLSPGGAMVLELAVERLGEGSYRYKAGPVQCSQKPNGKKLESAWDVEVSADGTRIADTVVYATSGDPPKREVVGRCVYRGHTITKELLKSAADPAGLQLVPHDPLRAIPLACCVLFRPQ